MEIRKHQTSILSFFKTNEVAEPTSSLTWTADKKGKSKKLSRLSRSRTKRKQVTSYNSPKSSVELSDNDSEVVIILEKKFSNEMQVEGCSGILTDKSDQGIGLENDQGNKVITSSSMDGCITGSSKEAVESCTLKLIEDEEATVPHSYYYHSNFLYIINSVLSDNDNTRLINEEDREVIDKFYSLTENSQKLYIRLFQRKLKWLTCDRIKYPEICGKSSPEVILDGLVSVGFIHSIEDLTEMSDAIDLLYQPELKELAKKLNFNPSLKGKSEIKKAILKHCQSHKSSSAFFNHTISLDDKLMKSLKVTIKKCYKLKVDPRRVFTRLLMLFSLPTMAEDENDASGGQQQQLLSLLWTNQGKIKFPSYDIVKTSEIFPNRESLINFEIAKQLESEILGFMENKDWSNALLSYELAKSQFKDINFDQCDTIEFLRKFTANYVYVKCLGHGIEILQKLKNYTEAISVIELLLSQTYCIGYRGVWWERLALNYDQHLKQPKKALQVIRKSLSDERVKISYYYNLHTRGQKLIQNLRKLATKGKNKSLKEENDSLLEDLPRFEITEAPKIIIQGRLFPSNIPGRKTYFISQKFTESTNDDETALMSVEELALDHYIQNGFLQGLHGEGSTFVSLFCLLFWDVIYGISVPDVFISPFQAYPLDLNSSSFYQHRKDRIDDKLEFLKAASEEVLSDILREVWEANFSTISLVSWDRFSGVGQLQGLLSCIPRPILSKICERFVKDFRHFRSGFPDLVVWNCNTRVFKVVEVKGPGDRLSSKQIIWLDYLLTIGVEAEVCYVEAIGAKKLKRE